jgi:lysophospholipase L1-like esterase
LVHIFHVILGAVLAFTGTAAGVVDSAATTPTATAKTAAVSTAPMHYVALGDSYSSGVGAGDDIPASGNCERSTDAYPEKWAAAHSPASFVSVACSGATTANVLSSQVSALNAKTTLVSITIGGNDAGFSTVMETCVLESTSSCLDAVETAENFVAAKLPARLDSTLQAIRAHAPSAKIVALGYPGLYDLNAGTCLGLSTEDRIALDGGANDLDSALQAAAQANHDTFADVRGKFSDHEICDSDSWLHAVDIFAISSSYHPTAAGQDLGYLPEFTTAAG